MVINRILLCGCQDVLHGCLDVARELWVVTRAFLECSGCLLGCCYAVARVFHVIVRMLPGCFG